MSLFPLEPTSNKYEHLAKRLGSWYPYFNEEDLDNLTLTLNAVELSRDTRPVYPPDEHIFRVYKETPPNKVSVVILGQDPYHKKGQAIGRAFASGKGIPPSLQMIKNNLCGEDDFDLVDFDPTLQNWVDSGVFLLNTALTVVSSKPGSHADIGWNLFINKTIKILNKNQLVIWLLWGNDAKAYYNKINTRHRIMLYEHPAFAARSNKSWDCPHFDYVNFALEQNNKKQIQWL